jgi:hypothetical protein
VRPRSYLTSFSIAALVLLASTRAEAFERQWHAGVDAGYASLFGDNSSAGFGGGAHLAYGLSDAFNALLELDFSRHPSVDTSVWSAGAGVAYTLDVARVVPYGGLMVAGYKLAGNRSKAAPGGQIVLGVDYQIDRHWAAGLQLRMHTIFASDAVGTTVYATTFLRFEYLWGF